MNWQQPFSSPDNREALGRLTEYFIGELKAGAYQDVEYERDAHKWSRLMTKLETTLQRQQSAERKTAQAVASGRIPEKVDTKTGPRRYSRRMEVCIL